MKNHCLAFYSTTRYPINLPKNGVLVVNKLMKNIGLIFVLLGLTYPSFAAQIMNVHVTKTSAEQSRVIFELSAPVAHNIFTLDSPQRLVVDLKNVELQGNITEIATDHSLFKEVRTAPRGGNDWRFVFDLKLSVRTKSYLAKPSTVGGAYQLIIDVFSASSPTPTPPTAPAPAQTAPAAPLVAPVSKPAPATPPAPKPAPRSEIAVESMKVAETTTPNNGREIIIAVDAGHGGIDPGASGRYGTKEKDVVLALAKELAQMINAQAGMRAVLIREGDYFLSLRKRIDLARQHQADLFVSIHADADAEKTSGSHGSSVYMLSQRGASSEAAHWLAEKENAADLIGGVSLNDKDELLASVLLDLSQSGTLEASAHLAQSVLNALSKIGSMHYARVQQAGFMVLRSPDIPSVLVETAFISNPVEEQRLNNAQARQRMAAAVFQGIQQYFNKYPAAGLLAKR